MTDCRLSAAKVLPIEVHETLDYAAGVTAIAGARSCSATRGRIRSPRCSTSASALGTIADVALHRLSRVEGRHVAHMRLSRAGRAWGPCDGGPASRRSRRQRRDRRAELQPSGRELSSSVAAPMRPRKLATSWRSRSPLARCSCPTRARATNVTEFPDNGSEQMGRGGAWVARATDPLATIFNPAGLAGQPTRLTLQSNIIFEHTCFTRVKAASDTTQRSARRTPAAHYPRVVQRHRADHQPADRRARSASPIASASASSSSARASAGEKTLPEFVERRQRSAAGRARALPARSSRRASSSSRPSASATRSIDNLRLGASFRWGFAKLKLATRDDRAQHRRTDARQRRPREAPGEGLLHPALHARRDLERDAEHRRRRLVQVDRRDPRDAATSAPRRTTTRRRTRRATTRSVRYGDTIFDDCGTGAAAATTASVRERRQREGEVRHPDGGEARLSLPPAARPVAARRRRARRPSSVRDPRAIRGSTSRRTSRSARDRRVRRRGRSHVGEQLRGRHARGSLSRATRPATARFPSPASPGGEIPPNADQPRGYKDVFGVRVGGDYNVLPDKLALRARRLLRDERARRAVPEHRLRARRRASASRSAARTASASGEGDEDERARAHARLRPRLLRRAEPHGSERRRHSRRSPGTSCNKSDSGRRHADVRGRQRSAIAPSGR